MWRTVRDAYALTWRNLGYLVRISWAWVLLMLPISLAYHAFAFSRGWPTAATFETIGSQVDWLVATLLYLPMLASIAVAWHRKLLANEDWPKPFYLRLDRTVAAYLGLAALISFLATAPLYFAVSLAGRADSGGSLAWFGWLTAAWVASLAVGLFISTRIWLVLPARALERSRASIADAWNGSRGNFWRLLGGCFLCTGPVWLFAIPLGLFNVDWTSTRQPLVYAGCQTLFELLTTFLAGMPVVSFLSLAYRQLIEGRSIA